MWVPVYEYSKLGSEPKEVNYLGSSIVIYKKSDGTVAALENKCPHRGVPLSQGKVVNDCIRCGFHHFCFNEHGENTSRPTYFQDSDKHPKSISFSVAIQAGLVWITPAKNAPDRKPCDETANAGENIEWFTDTVEVEGDFRVWMDHFLDPAHCLFTHVDTTLSGVNHDNVDFDFIKINIKEESQYPIVDAVEFGMTSMGKADYKKIYPWSKMLAARIFLSDLLSFKKDKRKAKKITASLNLITPFCQETKAKFGGKYASVITSLCPTSENKCTLFFSVRVDAKNKIYEKIVMNYAKYHLSKEDHHYMSNAVFTPSSNFNQYNLDRIVLLMRDVFYRYYNERRDSFPRDCLLHRMPYGNDTSYDHGENVLIFKKAALKKQG